MSGIVTLASGLDFPEGPSVATDGAIWLSELRGGRIVRVVPGEDVTRFDVGGAPNGTALASDGSLWFCDAARGQVRRLDLATGAATVMIDTVDDEPLAAPNDLAFHPDGSLVFTCPGSSRQEPSGYICRRAPDGSVSRIADGLLFPNGLGFSSDGSRLFVAETYACRVLSAAWEAQPRLEPLLTTPGPIGADGVAVARDGSVWATVYGAGCLVSERWEVALPDAHPAGCAADTLGRWDLLVTGTQTGTLLGVTL